MPVVQEGVYIARIIGHTHAVIEQLLEAVSSVRRGDSRLQGEGRKVEKQSQEMVKDILGRGNGGDVKYTAAVYLIVFLSVCIIVTIKRTKVRFLSANVLLWH